MASNYQKEKVRTISTTDQEIDAWEALRRGQGLLEDWPDGANG